MRRLFYATALGLLLASTVWLMGFIWFLSLMPSPHHLQVTYPTQAIVVLTGGAGRAEYGLQLLRENRARRLFISGVHEGSDKSAIFQQFRRMHPQDYDRLQARIELGRKALDTRGNAHETALWAQQKGITTLRLVTASYHMPRSLLEFERRLPQATLIPAPVFTGHFQTGDWWQDNASVRLVLSEYHKLIASMVFGVIEGK